MPSLGGNPRATRAASFRTEAVSRTTLLILVMMAVAASPGLLGASTSGSRFDSSRDRAPQGGNTGEFARIGPRDAVEFDGERDERRTVPRATGPVAHCSPLVIPTTNGTSSVPPTEPAGLRPMFSLLGGRTLDLPPPGSATHRA